jgi:hypothetical protein
MWRLGKVVDGSPVSVGGHMFEEEVLVRFDAGESWGDSGWADEHFDEVGYDDLPATLSDGGVDENRHVLDLDSIPPGPFIESSLHRTKSIFCRAPLAIGEIVQVVL